MPNQSLLEDPQGSEAGSKQKLNLIIRGMESLAHLGLGEWAMRLGIHVLTVLLVAFVLVLMQRLYRQTNPAPSSNASITITQVTPDAGQASLQLPQLASISVQGIGRLLVFHTTISDRPREDVTQYTVKSGDTVFSIADDFGLKPSTILLGNYSTLKNDVDLIRTRQRLNILPVDGAYYQWNATDNLSTVAKYYGVDPQAILDSPANHLDLSVLGDPTHPNIPDGIWLVIPGRMIQFSWNAPIGQPRNGTGATSHLNGPGACESVTGGNVGFGTWVFPTVKHWLSGTDYRPDVRHFGVDFAGAQGNVVYAADAGVVVYSGWFNGGYGNLIIMDRGNGWQTLYAHLSQINTTCDQSVGQADIIGLVGMIGGTSTGPHLHFEMSYNRAPVNPHTIYDISPP